MGFAAARMLAGVLVATGAIACGGDDGVRPDPAVAPFVGTWDAEEFTVTADAPPNEVADLLISGSFNITIEPSGQYTATLLVAGFPAVEFGQLTVAGATLTLSPDGGDPATSTYLFTGDDVVTLDGPTEFDFNLDMVDEPAQGHIVLRRRP